MHGGKSLGALCIAIASRNAVSAAIILGCIALTAGTTSQARAGANIVESTQLSLNTYVVVSGGQVTANVTFKNTGNASITIAAIGVGARTPSGGNGDFGWNWNQFSFAPGQTVPIQKSRTFTVSDPTGPWTVFASYETTDGIWHQLAPTLMLTVAGSQTWQATFTGSSLDTTVWNPFMTAGGASGGWPWHMQNDQGIPSSSIDGPNGLYLDYDLPSFVHTASPYLGLQNQIGSGASGFSWTGSVICSCPDTNYVNNSGFTFADKYVEVYAQMPWTSNGCWPAIWFLAAPGSSGPEIDLHEGGFILGSTDPDRVFACNVWHSDGTSEQHLIDSGVSLSSGFHKYGIAYKQGQYINTYFDGKLMVHYTNNVPSGLYFIILNNGVASSGTAGWHSQVSGQTQSTNWMSVQYIRAYAL